MKRSIWMPNGSRAFNPFLDRKRAGSLHRRQQHRGAGGRRRARIGNFAYCASRTSHLAKARFFLTALAVSLLTAACGKDPPITPLGGYDEMSAGSISTISSGSSLRDVLTRLLTRCARISPDGYGGAHLGYCTPTLQSGTSICPYETTRDRHRGPFSVLQDFRFSPQGPADVRAIARTVVAGS